MSVDGILDLSIYLLSIDSLVRLKADYLDICQAHMIIRLPLYTITFINLFYAVDTEISLKKQEQKT